MAGAFTEVGAKLGLDISSFESSLAKSGKSFDEFKRKAGKNLDVGDAGKAFAFALGLSIDRIGETFARMWTGVTKEAEAAFEKLSALSDKNTEDTLKGIASRRSSEEQYQALLKERDRLTRNPTKVPLAPPGGLEKLLSAGASNRFTAHLFGPSAKQATQNRLDTHDAEQAAAAEADKNRLEAIGAETKKIELEREKLITDAKAKTHELELERLDTAEKIAVQQQDLEVIDRQILDHTEGTIEKSTLQLARASLLKSIMQDQKQLGSEVATAAEKEAAARKKSADEAARLQKATDKVSDAEKDIAQAKSDQSGFTLQEVANPGRNSGVSQSQKAVAREALTLDAQAKRMRATGNTVTQSVNGRNVQYTAGDIQERANSLRSGMGMLTSSEQNPFAGAQKTLDDSLKELRDINKKMEPAAVR